MAKSIRITSGSLLIGSPILVSVTSESGLNNATFHRVKLIVTAALSSDGKQQIYELSAPAGSNENVVFDISTALRSVVASYKHEIVTEGLTYPYITYSLKAYDEWMLNGILTEEYGVQVSPSSGNHYALMGAFTDRERYLAGETKAVTTFTRKPITGEVCAKGELFVYPATPTSELGMGSTITSGPSVSIATLDSVGVQTFADRTIYVDPAVTDRILFQFVNGYGVVETISAEMLEEYESSGTVEVDAVTAPSAFGSPHTDLVRRSNRKNTMRCSSGYVNKEWASWWTEEFLGGDNFRRGGHSQCWVYLDGNWLPCTVIPADNIPLWNRSQPGMIQIEFDVTLM